MGRIKPRLTDYGHERRGPTALREAWRTLENPATTLADHIHKYTSQTPTLRIEEDFGALAAQMNKIPTTLKLTRGIYACWKHAGLEALKEENGGVYAYKPRSK